MTSITATKNEKVKQYVRLRSDKAYRDETGTFAIEGARLCMDACRSGIRIVAAFLTEKAVQKYADAAAEIRQAARRVYFVGEDAALRLSDTKAPQGLFCVCKKLDKSFNIDTMNTQGRYLALERVQNPDNLGAVARTCEALGLDGLIVSGGCDVWHPKALRASMGALFRLPVYVSPDLTQVLLQAKNAGMQTYAAVVSPDALPVTQIRPDGGVICAVGNEGNGLSADVIGACAHALTVPMRGRAESFNAAQAATIIAWEMVRPCAT